MNTSLNCSDKVHREPQKWRDFVLYYNSGVSRGISTLFALMEAKMNTIQRIYNSNWPSNFWTICV